MSKRFTEPEKWTKDTWFRQLTPKEKLVFLFLTEHCNNAGFIEKDIPLFAFLTGLSEVEVKEAIEGLSRAYIEADNWLWMRNFLKHQKNLPLNPENNAHKQIISLVQEQLERFNHHEDLGALLGANEPPGKVGYGKVDDSLKEKEGAGEKTSLAQGIQDWKDGNFERDPFTGFYKIYEDVHGRACRIFKATEREYLVDLLHQFSDELIHKAWRYFQEHIDLFTTEKYGDKGVGWFFQKFDTVVEYMEHPEKRDGKISEEDQELAELTKQLKARVANGD